jgi:formylglycine-generating enzyme required for sulfatase activity
MGFFRRATRRLPHALLSAALVCCAAAARADEQADRDLSAAVWQQMAARADEDEGVLLDLGGVALQFVSIGPAEFTQGAAEGDPQRQPDEARRPVRLTRQVFLSRSPVTRGQFAAFVAATGYQTEAEHGTSGGYGFTGQALAQGPQFNWRTPGFPQTDDHPVVLVTFADAQAFAAWAARASGRAVRLPTEAEFEYAARAGTETAWAAGERKEDALRAGWFKQNAGAGTHAVGEKAANQYGFLDLSGNVYQWCLDVYAPYAGGEQRDPLAGAPAPGEPARRVLRGGSWTRDPEKGRPAARYRSTPGTRSAEIGFRLVVDPNGAAPAQAGAVEAAPAQAGAGSAVGAQGGRPAADGLQQGGPAPGGACPSGVGSVGLGALLLAAFFHLRRRAAAARPTARPRGDGPRIESDGDLVVEPGVDGFWVRRKLRGKGGEKVSYRAQVGADSREGEVTLTDSGRGTFVYTGAAPTLIAVGAAGALAVAAHRSQSRRRDLDEGGSGPGPENSSFSGYPPAY